MVIGRCEATRYTCGIDSTYSSTYDRRVGELKGSDHMQFVWLVQTGRNKKKSREQAKADSTLLIVAINTSFNSDDISNSQDIQQL